MLTARVKDVDPLPDDNDLVAAIKAVAPGTSGADGKYMLAIINADGLLCRMVCTDERDEAAGITQYLEQQGFVAAKAGGVWRDMGIQTYFDRPTKRGVPGVHLFRRSRR